MNPLHRGHVNKGQSSKKFQNNTAKTHPQNMKAAPMRGGIRF
ncbi:MAG: hypothetical protein [Microvirus sp.]|nr:MAG: hypothetical protein [Microvirus sp.]